MSASFPGIGSSSKSEWTKNAANPVLPSGGPDSPDSAMASDPKVRILALAVIILALAVIILALAVMASRDAPVCVD